MWQDQTHNTDQLFRSHIVKNPLSILAVMAALHDGEKQLRCIVLRVEEEYKTGKKVLR